MLGKKYRVLKRPVAVILCEFRFFDELCGGFLSLRPQLVRDLLGAAFLFEEFALGLGRAALGFGRSVRVVDDRVDNGRRSDEQLLVDRDQFEQVAVLRRSGEPGDRVIGRLMVDEDSLVGLDREIIDICEKIQHPRRRFRRFEDGLQGRRILPHQRLTGRFR